MALALSWWLQIVYFTTPAVLQGSTWAFLGFFLVVFGLTSYALYRWDLSSLQTGTNERSGRLMAFILIVLWFFFWDVGFGALLGLQVYFTL